MMKPVWRLNTGNGVPSDASGMVFTPNSIQPFDDYSQNLEIDDLWILGNKYSIAAYQTTRTKKAKYRGAK